VQALRANHGLPLMHWVLIFAVVSSDFPALSVTATFDKKASCEAALDDLRKFQRFYNIEEHRNNSHHNFYIHSACYES
jgi:hypothetical protein